MSNVKLLNIAPQLDDARDVLDRLRADFDSGKVIAFCAVAVTPDEVALCYSAASRTTSRLRMQGAIAQLLHSYLDGDISTGGDG